MSLRCIGRDCCEVATGARSLTPMHVHQIRVGMIASYLLSVLHVVDFQNGIEKTLQKCFVYCLIVFPACKFILIKYTM